MHPCMDILLLSKQQGLLRRPQQPPKPSVGNNNSVRAFTCQRWIFSTHGWMYRPQPHAPPVPKTGNATHLGTYFLSNSSQQHTNQIWQLEHKLNATTLPKEAHKFPSIFHLTICCTVCGWIKGCDSPTAVLCKS